VFFIEWLLERNPILISVYFLNPFVDLLNEVLGNSWLFILAVILGFLRSDLSWKKKREIRLEFLLLVDLDFVFFFFSEIIHKQFGKRYSWSSINIPSSATFRSCIWKMENQHDDNCCLFTPSIITVTASVVLIAITRVLYILCQSGKPLRPSKSPKPLSTLIVLGSGNSNKFF
jgi:hypothetical protein